MDDLYPGTLSTESAPFGYAEIISRMDKLDTDMRKVQKKKKNSKKGEKKKLKQQLERLQMEHEQIKYFLSFIAMQQQQNQQHQGKGKKKKKKKQAQASVWWQNGLANSMPVVLNNLTKPKSQYLPETSQLYLSDGNGKK